MPGDAGLFHALNSNDSNVPQARIFIVAFFELLATISRDRSSPGINSAFRQIRPERTGGERRRKCRAMLADQARQLRCRWLPEAPNLKP
jgi:hypothetical protein